MKQIILKKENKTNKKYNCWLIFGLIILAGLLIFSFQLSFLVFIFFVFLGIFIKEFEGDLYFLFFVDNKKVRNNQYLR